VELLWGKKKCRNHEGVGEKRKGFSLTDYDIERVKGVECKGNEQKKSSKEDQICRWDLQKWGSLPKIPRSKLEKIGAQSKNVGNVPTRVRG